MARIGGFDWLRCCLYPYILAGLYSNLVNGLSNADINSECRYTTKLLSTENVVHKRNVSSYIDGTLTSVPSVLQIIETSISSCGL